MRAMRILLLALSLGAAHAAEPIRYTLRFPAAATHYVDVEAKIPAAGELMMAVWTPGSYLVREYSRQVEDVTVAGKRLTKTAKNRWRLDRPATVKYRVYAREMTVRTNWVDADFAMLNGAPTFLTLADGKPRPHDVFIEPAKGWKRSVTALPKHPTRKRHRYRAASYDQLVDSPIVVGNPTVHTFEAGGKPHVFAVVGEADVWDVKRAVADVTKIVTAQQAFWKTVPYERYVFMNLLVERGGGLEHLDSTLMLGSRWAMRKPENYRGWLGLVSHEFFHTWNVKRLRPVSLGPFDYEREVHTRMLWVAEGVTSYYDDLLLRRAGLMDDAHYLKALSKQVKTVQQTPGRFVRSLEDASYDAWIKFYRPDENSGNTSVSYYQRGAVAAWLLDARIRTASGGKRTLDDVMRAAYAKYGADRGYTPSEFHAVASEVAGADLTPWFAAATGTPGELDYREALKLYGLRFKAKKADPDVPDGGWLGAKLKGATVRAVPRGTPAPAGGVNVEDELVGIDQHHVAPDKWDDRLGRYRPGAKVSLLVARRGRLRRLDVQLGKAPADTWVLEADPKATEAQKAARKSWLTGA